MNREEMCEYAALQNSSICALLRIHLSFLALAKKRKEDTYLCKQFEKTLAALRQMLQESA